MKIRKTVLKGNNSYHHVYVVTQGCGDKSMSANAIVDCANKDLGIMRDLMAAKLRYARMNVRKACERYEETYQKATARKASQG